MKEFIFGNIRVQFYGKDVVRLEYAKKGKFFDGETLFVAGKDDFKEDAECKLYANYLVFGDYSLSVPEDARGLTGVMLAKNGTTVYRYKKLKYSPDLPAVDKTPEAFAVADCPRILIPAGGYAFRKLKNCGFKAEDNVQDVYILLCQKSAKKLRELFFRLSGRRAMPPVSAFGKRGYAEDAQAGKALLDAGTDNILTDGGEGAALKKLAAAAHERGAFVCVKDDSGEISEDVFDPQEVKRRVKILQGYFKQGADCVLPAKLNDDITGAAIQSYVYYDVAERFFGGSRRHVCGDLASCIEAELRYTLMPAIYAAAYENYLTGEPVIKRLGQEYTAEKRAIAAQGEYILGKNLLINAGGGEEIYLPKGKWLSLSGGKTYAGGKCVSGGGKYFIRLGGLLPLAYAADSVAAQRWDRLVLDFYPDKNAEDCGFIYEDDGVSSDYKKGAMRKCEYSAKYDETLNAYIITIKAGAGFFNGERYFEKRAYTLKYHQLSGAGAVTKVTVNGGEIPFEKQQKNAAAGILSTEKSCADCITFTAEIFTNVISDCTVALYL